MKLFFNASLVMLCFACAQEDSSMKATSEGRYALGKASEYPANPLTIKDRDLARKSMLFRRNLGWSIFEKVVAPIRPEMSDLHNDILIPRWMSWYAKDDFNRLFAKSFTMLSPEARKRKDPIGPAIFSNAETWLASQLEDLPQWSKQQRDAYLARLSDVDGWQGSMGLSRSLFSSSAVRHMITNYQDLMDCNVERCLTSSFTADSVIVKASWVRRGHGFSVPAYDTDANALSRRLSKDGNSWDVPDREISDSNRTGMISIRTSSGAVFDLTGLHIMTKESQDWLWLTLWWSDVPDSDFGEDRPRRLKEGPWFQYKMCVVADFAESASDDADLNSRYPSLGLAVNATRDESFLSWCSNPYLEKGANNQKTNCIGCHQHAASRTTPEMILNSNFQGRAKVLSQFPADYVWSLKFGPENLSHLTRERVLYHSQ